MMKKILAAAAFVLIVTCGCASLIGKGDTMRIVPDNSSITYTGRIDASDKRAPRFDWPGVSIGISFENSSKCSVLLDDGGGNDFNVFIDGKQAAVIEAKKGEQEYVLASGLSAGRHSVLITKRTETYDGITVFRGFELDAGAALLPADKKCAMKIEFIGDSLTVGYGVEGAGIKCDSERKNKNNYLAFSSVAARKLGAEYNIVAISGRGVVRNYGEKTETSAEPLPLYYDRTLMNDGKKWDFKSWVPGAVVINLGTNDYSTEPKPDKNVFIKNYLKLIERVRENYPAAHLFICAGPTQSEPFFECVKLMKKGIQDKQVHWVKMAPLTEKDWGCDYHPNIKAAERMAKELVKEIKKVYINLQPSAGN